MSANAKLIEDLRRLVALNEPRYGGPYQGVAAELCVIAMSQAADTIARLEEENGRLRMEIVLAKPLYSRRQIEARLEALRVALEKIVGMDSHIDATVSGGRKVVHGPIAVVAARALSDGER